MRASLTNRRIGDRVPVDINEVEWEPAGQRRSLLRRNRPTARIVEFSVSGAGIIAPAEPPLVVGHLVTIRAQGHEGTVRVRRVEPTGDPATVRYGVAFVCLDTPLHDLIAQRIAGTFPEPVYYWDETRLNRTRLHE